MMTENLEKQIEKQIGCMSGFLHIFDRQQILSNKRIHSTKRLPPSTGVDASPESVKSVKSVKLSPLKAVEKPGTVEPVVSVPQSPDRFKLSPASNNVTPPKSPLPFPLFETKEGTMRSSWKFCKEMPRLSLDSRATVDSKGSLCPKDNEANSRSPSVIARLMGLEQLPSSDSGTLQSLETAKKPELRRSASESRVSRDLFHSRFVEGNGLKPNQTNKQPVETNLINDKMRDNVRNRNGQNGRGIEARKHLTRNQKSESQWRPRSFFNSGDFFPEPKQTTMQMYGDSEKLLKMRGIDDQTNDLESLKHILEALQLKGLLHSKRPLSYNSQRNFVSNQSFMPSDDSNIVVMKPWRSGGTNQRFGNTLGGVNNRYSSESLPSPKKEYGGIDRSGRSPVRSRNAPPVSRNCNTIVKRKSLSIETQRSFNDSTDSSRRNSPLNSPKLTPKRNGSRSGSDYQFVTNRSPRNRRPADMIGSNKKAIRNFRTEDESSSFTESSGSTTSQSDPERPKTEEYREGKSLLARCDKLLNSIAEMNTITESHTSSNSVLPSPVSVLDSVFDNNESSSPSPVMKRSIDFKDVMVDMDDDIWNSIIFSSTSTNVDESEYDDSDYTYISDILRASRYIPDDSGVYYFLEKEKYGNDTSKSNKVHRKLVFDAVVEILDQKRELPPWNADSVIEYGNRNKQVYSEFSKIREPETADNVLDLICVVLKRDLARSNGWGDHPVEISEAVLYIERMIFKDLICETIQHLAKFAGKSTFFTPRRKLVF